MDLAAPGCPAPFFAGGVSPVGEAGSRSRAFLASSKVFLSEKYFRTDTHVFELGLLSLEYHAPTYDKSAFNKLSSHYLH